MSDPIIKEIARQLNKKVNIPFLSEKTEQKLFEVIAKAVLEVLDEMFFAKLGSKPL